MNNIEIEIEVLLKVVRNIATDDEQQLFDVWVNQSTKNRELYERAVNLYSHETGCKIPNVDHKDIDSAWSSLIKTNSKLFEKKKYTLFQKLMPYVAIVTVGAILTIISVYIYNDIRQTPINEPVREIVADNIAPKFYGSPENDIKITNSEGIYVIDKEGDKHVVELAKVEKVEEQIKPMEIEYQTIEVPSKREYIVELSDGSVVHLNANSKLKYPINIKDLEERKVFLSGEAYFNVAHNANSRFIVETDNAQIAVYGTQFNISTYKKGVTETVLVEGSVSVKGDDNDKEHKIKPGQIAILKENKDIEVYDVDTQNYISWMNNVYTFDNESLYTIMSSVASWYGYSVVFENDSLSKMRFIFNMPRMDKIEDILNSLMMSKRFKYEIKDKTIHIISY